MFNFVLLAQPFALTARVMDDGDLEISQGVLAADSHGECLGSNVALQLKGDIR